VSGGCRRFEGKVALVTGGGSGIGRATAVRLAREGGAAFVCGLRADALEESVGLVEEAGGRGGSLSVDLRERDAADRVVEAAVAWGGGLHVLVNCAGTFPYTPFPDELTDAGWADALEINLNAPMRTCRAATPHLRATGGTVVNVSSINAEIGDAISKCAPYSAAKAGLLALTRQIAVELSPEVRVVGVLPGSVDTPMNDDWLPDPAEREAWLQRYVPLRRMLTAEEIAAVIAFLASDDASSITGTAVVADGGASIV
jgi:meso-butanediol dehydrogenase/(S,S)-butanediol dehydrogenase/diacetyl reductase